MPNQDSAFYTNEAGTEVVWSDMNNPYYVVRAGEMKIYARHNPDDEHTVIRYTDQLEDFGITTDEQLAKWNTYGDEFFFWDNNSWFEIYNDNDREYYADPFHELDEAINFAKEANK